MGSFLFPRQLGQFIEKLLRRVFEAVRDGTLHPRHCQHAPYLSGAIRYFSHARRLPQKRGHSK